MSIRVLIADDHLIIRQGLKLLFGTESELQLVGEAENGQEAVKLAEELNPDVVVMDLSMPVMDGFQASKIIRREQPEVKIVALSMHNDRAFVQGMVEVGAHGYVLKDAAFEELAQAIHEVCEGRTYFR